jgi:type II secretory pathway pseudopilin PulG
MIQIKNKKNKTANEKGVALVVVIMLIAVLAILGATAIITSSTDIRISGNYKLSNQAFYIAEAGIERARAQLRSDMFTNTLSQLLAARVGGGGVLSDSTNIVNFYSNGAFVTDDIPYIAQTSFGGGNYRVYLTNDAKTPDTVTSTTDTNLRVTLTAFGQGPNNSFSIVQVVGERLTLPPHPGAIVLPGPDVIFHGGHSNASGVEGNEKSAVALTSPTAESTVENNLIEIGRIKNYTCDSCSGKGIDCIKDESALISSTWNTVGGVESLYNSLKSVADVVVTGDTTLTADQVGTTSNRKIVVVDGKATLGPVNGAGILIVTDQLTLNGNFDYHGLIMCIGQGSLLRNGGGNGTITGSIFVAKTRDPSNNLLTTLGIPTFNTDGGGNSDIIYDASQLSPPPAGQVFLKKSWQQL